jgi:membrane glycosyltransferase
MPRDDMAGDDADCAGSRPTAPFRPAMGRRRSLFFALVGLSIAALAALFVRALLPGGLGWLELVLALLFTLTLPWLVIGFWNSVIGFLVLAADRGRLDRILPIARPDLAPDLAPGRAPPIASRTAIVVPIHEEDPEQVFLHLRTVLASLAATGEAAAFEVFVLSDTRSAATARREAALFQRLAEAHAHQAPALHYRRRAVNTGFKAGNIRAFLDEHGDRFPFMIVLDADSVMTGAALVRLVRLMQANPRLGILQTLVVGLPSDSAFARIFQFGMRHGMRAYTMGSAWWQGDCGPYWGHNAIIRLAPFIAHCRLPTLPGAPPLGGPVLSHDQVEAVLMRRAGYDVRVLPVEDGSWEANPPTLPDFAKRDLRWCQGNMQYLRLRLPGLHRLGRLQLGLAVLMYTGSPLWLAFLAVATLMLFTGPGPAVLTAGHTLPPSPALGLAVFALVIGMALAPKLFGLLHAFTSAAERRAFGGAGRLAAGAAADLVFSALLAPLMSVAHTRFIAGLPFRRTLEWRRQRRTGRAVSWPEAVAGLWPQTLLGLAWLATLAALAPQVLPWAAPVLAALVLAMPFAVLTADPGLGRRLAAAGLCATPEERAPPAEVAAVCPWLGRPAPLPAPRLAGAAAEAGE